NSPTTSPSGNAHGMPLAVALGLANDPRFESSAWPLPMIVEQHTALVGVRSVDGGERARLREVGVRVFTMEDVDRRGMRDVMEEPISIASGSPFLHVSFDMDLLAPDRAPGAWTALCGGT